MWSSDEITCELAVIFDSTKWNYGNVLTVRNTYHSPSSYKPQKCKPITFGAHVKLVYEQYFHIRT